MSAQPVASGQHRPLWCPLGFRQSFPYSLAAFMFVVLAAIVRAAKPLDLARRDCESSSVCSFVLIASPPFRSMPDAAVLARPLYPPHLFPGRACAARQKTRAHPPISPVTPRLPALTWEWRLLAPFRPMGNTLPSISRDAAFMLSWQVRVAFIHVSVEHQCVCVFHNSMIFCER